MDTEVQAVFEAVIPAVKTSVVGTYAYILPALLTFIVALWAIRFGWGKVMGAMRGRH
jgi:hypothetical protein